MKRSSEGSGAGRTLLVGVAGGSGSGKTTFAHALYEALGPGVCSVLSQDHYYIDQSARFTGDGESVNFDHPGALDWPLMLEHLRALKEGRGIAVPIYDFASHKRLSETTAFEPRPVVIVDGTLILSQPEIRGALDRSVFIRTAEALRYERRLRRDVQERGRTPEGVKKQFERQVKPMHDQYVEPTLGFAHEVISGEESLNPHVEAWTRRILSAGSGSTGF